MFTFLRSSTGAAEVWHILMPENSRPNAKKRFGAALIHDGTLLNGCPPKCHDVGMVFVIHREDEVEILVAGKKGLLPEEESMMSFQLESLLGAHVHSGGEPVKGWYSHDTLRRS